MGGILLPIFSGGMIGGIADTAPLSVLTIFIRQRSSNRRPSPLYRRRIRRRLLAPLTENIPTTTQLTDATDFDPGVLSDLHTLAGQLAPRRPVCREHVVVAVLKSLRRADGRACSLQPA